VPVGVRPAPVVKRALCMRELRLAYLVGLTYVNMMVIRSQGVLAAMNKNELLIQLSESDRTRIGKQDFGEQSFPQQVFTAVWEVESEVNNGGFAQYFSNESAESAGFVVRALKEIGAPRTADICERAIVKAFPNGLPAAVEAIRASAEEFPEAVLSALGDLDQEFYSYPNDLTALLFAFVAAHPEEFGVLPEPSDA
jgi:hypothetical protein